MSESREQPVQPKYLKPKVLLVDLPANVFDVVKAAGFNAQCGTFGRPYRVPVSPQFVPVSTTASLPNYSEQEVVVIDLTSPETADCPEEVETPVDGERSWFAKCSRGEIDPRPRVMATLQENADRILKAGGVFVVFARPRLTQKLLVGETRFGELVHPREIDHDNWSFLSVLDREHLGIDRDHGAESTVCETLRAIDNFLKRHQDGLEFECAFRPSWRLDGAADRPMFIPLMTNKYGGMISGMILFEQRQKGKVLILPQLRDKATAVLELLQTVLPELWPHLFPFAEGARWVHGDEYEHPGVLAKRTRQEEIRRRATEQVNELEREIEGERAQLSYVHGLLINTGDDLVAGVKSAFEAAGLQKLVIGDEAEVSKPNKQEDLQVHDRSPLLLVEVKGIGGLPREKDMLQVAKYVLRRMRALDRRDVHGLSIVNHQRHLPALDRDHEHVFTPAQVEDAELNRTGLMTTWDLFRLLRGKSRWGWTDEAVCGVLYRTGRVHPYPTHYTALGTVAKFWPNLGVVSIDIDGEHPLRLGDRLGVLLPAGFHEEEVVSLQVENKPVQEATPGQRVGCKTSLGKEQVPVGMPVFLVKPMT